MLFDLGKDRILGVHRTGSVNVTLIPQQITNIDIELNSGVYLVAWENNRGIVFVGFSSTMTTGTDQHNDGFPLSLQPLLVRVPKLNMIWLASDNSKPHKAFWMAV